MDNHYRHQSSEERAVFMIDPPSRASRPSSTCTFTSRRSIPLRRSTADTASHPPVGLSTKGHAPAQSPPPHLPTAPTRARRSATRPRSRMTANARSVLWPRTGRARDQRDSVEAFSRALQQDSTPRDTEPSPAPVGAPSPGGRGNCVSRRKRHNGRRIEC